MVKKYVNNHKVTCSECLYVKTLVFYEDGMAFRCGQKCLLGYETDYKIPYKEHWDCEYYREYNFFKRIWFILKNMWKGWKKVR